MRTLKRIILVFICLCICILVFTFINHGTEPAKNGLELSAENYKTALPTDSQIIKFESSKELQTASEKYAVKVISEDAGDYLDVIDSSVILGICTASNTKYLYVGDALNGMGIIESSKEELEKMYKEKASETIKAQGNEFEVESIDQMETDAIAVLKEISSNNESEPNVSVTYSCNDSFISTAFWDHIGKSSNTKGSTSTGKYDTKGHFEEAELSLELTNFNVEKVIGGESSARLGIITIVVSADTKCVRNEGTYKDLSWIPDAGEARNIRYAVQFWADCYNGSLHEVVMEDLSIAE